MYDTSVFSEPLSATMRLVILDDYNLASEWAAKYICNRIVQFQPSAERYFTLGLPTGQPRISTGSIKVALWLVFTGTHPVT